MYKKIFSAVIVLVITKIGISQSIDQVINPAEVERVEKTLSSDDMQGRKVFTPGIDKAADFIVSEFKKAGLKPWKGDSYFQEFFLLRMKFISAEGTVNGKPFNERTISVVSCKHDLSITESSGYQKIKVGPKDTLYPLVSRLLTTKGNYLLVVDSVHNRLFNSLKTFKRSTVSFEATIVAILSQEDPTSYSINFKQEVTNQPLKNIVGVLPGKKKKDESVIFSGHYDHLGIGKPNEAGDSIYNGANDDAAGTTAVIMLANYFAKEKNNERTLIFAAFTAEEIGEYGSQYFATQFDPTKVMAMFNIEMIGTESKWGTNSAWITGYERTDMGKILEKNLEGTTFKFYPDPYPQQGLFYRSDNASLARQGVPAHTISTSKMDNEKNYHKVTDEIGTLDMKNMAEIIKAIAISSGTIVSGKDTPTRVDPAKM